jgi:hypothetical protein
VPGISSPARKAPEAELAWPGIVCRRPSPCLENTFQQISNKDPKDENPIGTPPLLLPSPAFYGDEALRAASLFDSKEAGPAVSQGKPGQPVCSVVRFRIRGRAAGGQGGCGYQRMLPGRGLPAGRLEMFVLLA